MIYRTQNDRIFAIIKTEAVSSLQDEHYAVTWRKTHLSSSARAFMINTQYSFHYVLNL